IQVQMAIAAGPYEVSDAKIGLLRDQVRQQSVRRDVERDAQKEIGAALGEVARELPLGHIELEKRMAWRQLHAGDLADVPRRDDQAPRVRVLDDLRDDLRELVDLPSVRRGP